MIETARLNTAFLDVAVAGDMAIPWSLPRLVGAGKARDPSLFPRRIHADEALAIGLVSRVLSAQSFGDDVDALVNTLLEKSPTALTGLNQNCVAAEQMPLREFVQHEAKRHLQIAASEHTAEAFRAFVEKRKPNFT